MGAEGAYTHRFKDDDDEGADVAAVGHLRIRRGCLRDARDTGSSCQMVSKAEGPRDSGGRWERGGNTYWHEREQLRSY